MGKSINLIGKTFGRLSVIERAENDKYGKAQWLCKCECGNTVISTKFHLEHGHVVSCGCSKAEKAKQRIESLIGQKFNRLLVIGRAENNKQGKAVWICKCDCGKETHVTTYYLKSGKIKSCGCYNSELVVEKNFKHGYCVATDTHPLYHVRNDMIRRCTNPKSSMYYRYGGRGIRVCDEWLNKPKSFIEWALANGWKKGLQIDRINNDGNYEPSNCQFLTQADNTSKAQRYHIVVNGEDHSLREWDSILGHTYQKCSKMFRQKGEAKLIEYIKQMIVELQK